MKVHVKFAGDMHKKYSVTDLWLILPSEVTVKEILAKLENEKGIKINLENSSTVILVNGRRVDFIGGLNANLKDMDEIVIMPIIAGG